MTVSLTTIECTYEMAKQCNYSNCTNPVFARLRCKWHQQPKTDARGEEKTKVTKYPIAKNKPRIKAVSVKQSELLRLYAKIAAKFKKDNPFCAARLPGCTLHTTDVHHKKSRGEYLLVIEYFLPVCRSCHNWIHQNDAEARKLGFLESKFNNN